VITESGEQIAVVANQIVTARHKLVPMQQKIIAWSIAQIARDDTDFLTHTLNVADFALLSGSTSGDIYRQMDEVTSSLLSERLEIRLHDGERKRVKFQWFSECTYNDNRGTVVIKLHERLRPYLLELKRQFTQLRIDKFFKFRSTYTIRFFERCEMNRGKNVLSWVMTLNELRDWLGIAPEMYAFFGLFRARVLDVAQKELDEKSDWSFSFETIKTGRKITGVEFTLRPSRAPKVDPLRQKWKRATPETREQVMRLAREWPRSAGKIDAEIVGDPTFWEHLGELFEAVEKGQGNLGL
jgi:plasmid replication initiation protein